MLNSNLIHLIGISFMKEIEFTQPWFEQTAKPLWNQFIRDNFTPNHYLEIGSFEGASVCWVLENMPTLETVVCIDTWEGGEEHKAAGENMSRVEEIFDSNIEAFEQKNPEIQVNLVKLKSRSVEAMGNLIAEGYSGYFDFIYVDGSHRAPDVLTDLVMSFELLKFGGLLVADDYLWDPDVNFEGGVSEINPLRSPKWAIDTFANIFRQNLRQLGVPAVQFMALKT